MELNWLIHVTKYYILKKCLEAKFQKGQKDIQQNKWEDKC
jgi:hypothetical protein